MRLAFDHLRCKSNAIFIINCLDDLLMGHKSNETVQASNLRDLVGIWGSGDRLAGTHSHGYNACVDSTVHDSLHVHWFYYAADCSNGALSKASIAAMRVILSHNFVQSLLADHLQDTVNFAIFFEAVDKTGQFPVICELLQLFYTGVKSVRLFRVF